VAERRCSAPAFEAAECRSWQTKTRIEAKFLPRIPRYLRIAEGDGTLTRKAKGEHKAGKGVGAMQMQHERPERIAADRLKPL